MLNLASFWKRETCGQTVLPDRSILVGQKWWKMPKLKKSNETFWVIFKQCVLDEIVTMQHWILKVHKYQKLIYSYRSGWTLSNFTSLIEALGMYLPSCWVSSVPLQGLFFWRHRCSYTWLIRISCLCWAKTISLLQALSNGSLVPQAIRWRTMFYEWFRSGCSCPH